MIHDTAETVPAKVYFKIADGGELKLLSSDGSHSKEELEAAWKKISDEYNAISHESKESAKNLNIYKRLESLVSEYKSVLYYITSARYLRDPEMILQLNEWGYKIEWNEKDSVEDLLSQLDTAENHLEGLMIKIKVERNKLPKPKSGTHITFEENVLGYAAFTDQGYVDPNTLPLLQYHALVAMGNKKMKHLKDNGNTGKNNKKGHTRR